MTIIAFIGCLGAGLVAGVFFAFSSFVMAALERVPPAEGMAAMQQINITVINPVFMAVFLGMGLLSAVALWRNGFDLRSPLFAAAAIYLVGVLGVTFAFNVPMNDALASAQAASPEGQALWTDYLSRWTTWNHVRGLAALVASALFLASYGRQ
jgi:uncharacterized membrane protein